jgi:hypothetical protein
MNCAISALLLVLEVAPPAPLEVEVLAGVELVVAVEAVELVAGGVEALLLDEVELLPHPVVSATVASASASTGSRRMSILLLPSIRPRSQHPADEDLAAKLTRRPTRCAEAHQPMLWR